MTFSDVLDGIGQTANAAGGAAKAYKDAFGNLDSEDKRAAKRDIAWNPKMIGLIIGGVILSAVVLKFVFRR